MLTVVPFSVWVFPIPAHLRSSVTVVLLDIGVSVR
jgi:hypothetical protein